MPISGQVWKLTLPEVQLGLRRSSCRSWLFIYSTNGGTISKFVITICQPKHCQLCFVVVHGFRQDAHLCGAVIPVFRVVYFARGHDMK